MSNSESHYMLLSQNANVKGNNMSANSHIGLELLTYFPNEIVNYSHIDFFCMGKMRNV